MATKREKAIEIRRVGDPDPLNQSPYYAPCGRLLNGRVTGDFGGSSEQYARRVARKMLRSGRFSEVWIELSWSAGMRI